GCTRVGPAEGARAIAQARAYPARAPQSTAVSPAFPAAVADARARPDSAGPVQRRTAPTTLLNERGYGQADRYAHDEPPADAAGAVS
ncbi:recombination factor protein RarA, partial [Salmonella enterica subsp. enterica serovar Infantis]